MRGLDLVSLRYFMAALRSGSIAEAARREDIATSALSRRISELEDRLGVVLLHRGAHGVTATAAGETVRDRGRHILDLVARLESELADHQSGQRGEVRVAAVAAAVSGVLADDLAAFEAANAGARVVLGEARNADAIRRVEDGVADFGVVIDYQVPSTLHRAVYASDPIWVIGPRGHPLFDGLADDAAIPFAEAADHDVIALQGGASIDALTLAAASAIDRPLRKHFTVDRYDSLRRLVEVGLGIGFIRRSGYLPFRDVMAIDGRPVADSWADRRLCLVTASPEALSPAARLLFHFLMTRAAQR